jgi:hypothetical protein
MPTLARWTDRIVTVARQAFPPVDALGANLSAAFVVAGSVQGAIHVPVRAADATPEAARRLATALEGAHASEAVRLKVVWCAVTSGAHEGVLIDGLTLKIEPLDAQAAVEDLHIGQMIQAAQSLSEASVVQASRQLEAIFELTRVGAQGTEKALEQFSAAVPLIEALLETSAEMLRGSTTSAPLKTLDAQLRRLSQALAEIGLASSTAWTEASAIARRLEENANGLLDALQFQDRTNQMLDDVASQARALMSVAGVSETPASERRLNQVGALGRTLKSDDEEPVLPVGHVELF